MDSQSRRASIAPERNIILRTVCCQPATSEVWILALRRSLISCFCKGKKRVGFTVEWICVRLVQAFCRELTRPRLQAVSWVPHEPTLLHRVRVGGAMPPAQRSGTSKYGYHPADPVPGECCISYLNTPFRQSRSTLTRCRGVSDRTAEDDENTVPSAPQKFQDAKYMRIYARPPSSPPAKHRTTQRPPAFTQLPRPGEATATIAWNSVDSLRHAQRGSVDPDVHAKWGCPSERASERGDLFVR